MSKYGNEMSDEMSDETKKVIIQLTESRHRAHSMVQKKVALDY